MQFQHKLSRTPWPLIAGIVAVGIGLILSGRLWLQVLGACALGVSIAIPLLPTFFRTPSDVSPKEVREVQTAPERSEKPARTVRSSGPKISFHVAGVTQEDDQEHTRAVNALERKGSIQAPRVVANLRPPNTAEARRDVKGQYAEERIRFAHRRAMAAAVEQQRFEGQYAISEREGHRDESIETTWPKGAESAPKGREYEWSRRHQDLVR